MSGEDVYDDSTSSDTEGERHEGLLCWSPCLLAGFSVVLMTSVYKVSPGGAGSCLADVMRLS